MELGNSFDYTRDDWMGDASFRLHRFDQVFALHKYLLVVTVAEHETR